MNTDNSDFKARKVLPHEVPSWVSDGADYFITICTLPRGEDCLCKADAAIQVKNGFLAYHQMGKWYVHLLLLMPDHLHAIMSFARDPGVKKPITSWKQYLARQAGIKWQRDFFEHRLRPNEGFREKAEYIRQNPVRAGLVASAEEWPYCWSAQDFRQGGLPRLPALPEQRN